MGRRGPLIGPCDCPARRVFLHRHNCIECGGVVEPDEVDHKIMRILEQEDPKRWGPDELVNGR